MSQKKSPPSEPLSLRKRFLFFLFLILIPVLFFTGFEVILRLTGYGPNLSLFMTETIAGKEYLMMNPEVKSRYFNQVDFKPTTSPEYFLMPKPPGTFRIFCLGGSTTVGYPYWYNGSFSSFLRDRLKATFPNKNIEVINLGMTATNSFTTLDLAVGVVSYEPDLLLVYDGHNEFYGALGVASNESVGSSRWATMLYLKLVHLKTFHLVRDLLISILGWFGKADATASRAGTMMERLSVGQYIAHGESRYKRALSSFEDNLEGLRSIAREHSIPLLLGTQVSNLKEQPPFVSSNHETWPISRRQEFAKNLSTARTAVRESRITEATDILRPLLLQDTQHAEVHYLLGRCFAALGKYDSARAEFILARDYDELRFRTSSDFNDRILALRQSPLVEAVDMELLFAGSSPHELIGNDLITEHLHPNARGYFLMAKAYAQGMRNLGVVASKEEWWASDTLSDKILWDARHLTELDELIAKRRTEVLTSGWPFKDQYPIVEAVPEGDTLRFIAEQATRGIWNWKRAHEEAAEYYERRGETSKAELEYRTIINQIPLDVRAYLRLARLRLDRNLIGLARQTLLASLTAEETPRARRDLGDIALRSGRAEDAVTHYERLSRFPQSPQERDENGYLLALAYLQFNKVDSAEKLLERVLRENPANLQASALLKRIREVSAQQAPPRR